jgi:hypothetical protein
MKIETLLSRPEGKTLELKSMPDINPEALDVRVASGLFAGFREAIGKSAYDPQKRYLPAKESQS